MGKASRRVSSGAGEAGDGSYKCRLYQRGAQKIIGFEFGADVTMDMSESYVKSGTASSAGLFAEERRINFKCVESQFFTEFDGTWRVVQMPDNPFTGEAETTVSYTVDVRPKGPVPVAALEWRIREDVPTNLRAVKKASLTVGEAGVIATQRSRETLKQSVRRALVRDGGSVNSWQENETMAAYLK